MQEYKLFLFLFLFVGGTYRTPLQQMINMSTTLPETSIHHFYYSKQVMRWSLRGVNILSAVRGEYNACRWTEDFLLVSAKVT
jgi:hypothetical protein